MCLTKKPMRGYTTDNSASSEKSAVVKTKPTSEDEGSTLLTASASKSRDSAQKCETLGTDAGVYNLQADTGTRDKGAKAAPGPSRPSAHAARRRAHSQQRKDLIDKLRRESFLVEHGKFIARETATLFVEEELDFDPKRDSIYKHAAKTLPVDPVALAKQLVSDIINEIELEGSSSVLTGITNTLERKV